MSDRSYDDGCRCWNEGQWGRVHTEDCPIHGDGKAALKASMKMRWPVIWAWANGETYLGHELVMELQDALNFYGAVACTGDYNCKSSKHVEGCFSERRER